MYADRYGQTTADGVVLPVRLSHQDLAEMIGTQRPTVSRTPRRAFRPG